MEEIKQSNETISSKKLRTAIMALLLVLCVRWAWIISSNSASLDFWESWSKFGILLVIVGVTGEGVEFIVKEREEKWELVKKQKHWFGFAEKFFWMLVVIGLIIERRCGDKITEISDRNLVEALGKAEIAEQNAGKAVKEAGQSNERAGLANERAANTESNNLVLQTNILSLQVSVMELAHLYDQSTNALAEANARLRSIKPLKERLIDVLTSIDPDIMQKMRNGARRFTGQVDTSKLADLEKMQREPGASEYIISIERTGGTAFSVNGIITANAAVTLSPNLLKP